MSTRRMPDSSSSSGLPGWCVDSTWRCVLCRADLPRRHTYIMLFRPDGSTLVLHACGAHAGQVCRWVADMIDTGRLKNVDAWP